MSPISELLSQLIDVPFPIIWTLSVLIIISELVSPDVYATFDSTLHNIVMLMLFKLFRGMLLAIVLFSNTEKILRFYYLNTMKSKLYDSFAANSHLLVMFSILFIKLFVITDDISHHNDIPHWNKLLHFDILHWNNVTEFDVSYDLFNMIKINLSSDWIFSSCWLFSFIYFYRFYFTQNVVIWRIEWLKRQRIINAKISNQIISEHVEFIDDIVQIITDYMYLKPTVYSGNLYERLIYIDDYNVFNCLILGGSSIFLLCLSMKQINVIVTYFMMLLLWNIFSRLVVLIALFLFVCTVVFERVWQSFCANFRYNTPITRLFGIDFLVNITVALLSSLLICMVLYVFVFCRNTLVYYQLFYCVEIGYGILFAIKIHESANTLHWLQKSELNLCANLQIGEYLHTLHEI